MNQVQVFDESQVLISSTESLVKKLLETKHYAKMGELGLMAIISMARALKLDPILALGGLLYYTPQGKVEMSARCMNMLIRKAGHTMNIEADSEKCTIIGTRCDTGEKCTASFTRKEAEQIGLMKKQNWRDYTEDMLFARALSRLARRLFPELIGDCYVEGEVDLTRLDQMQAEEVVEEIEKPVESVGLSEEGTAKVVDMLLEHYQDKLPKPQYLYNYLRVPERLKRWNKNPELAFNQILEGGERFINGYVNWLKKEGLEIPVLLPCDT